MSSALVEGSLGAIAKDSGKSLAQTFIGAEVVVLVDTSGSMAANDSVGSRSRYDQACIELAGLQGSLPGKIAVLSFSDRTMFCPDGKPFNQSAGTDLVGALKFAKMADVEGIRFIVISDGQPNDESGALAVAKTYRGRIDVIYVGPEHDAAARNFLQRLAKASGGQAVTADRVIGLASEVRKLLVTT